MIISISVSKEDLRLIDDYCSSTGIPRSRFFVKSALKEVGVHPKDLKEPITSKSFSKAIEKRMKKEQKENKPIKLCKHGNMPSLCKHEKCRK